MNKDAILATLIGFAIGLCITGILLASPSIAKFLPRIDLPKFSFLETNKKAKPTATPTPASFNVTIDSPIAEAIEDTEELLVSGKTAAGASVIVQGNVDEAVVVAKADGQYAGRITLVEGKNEISVTSYTQELHATQTVIVYYTPESL